MRKGNRRLGAKSGYAKKSKLQCGLDAASGWLKGRVHVIFVAVKKGNWGGLSRKFGTKSWLVCVQKTGVFTFSQTFLFLKDNFLFS